MFIHKLQTSCISWLSRFSGSLRPPCSILISVVRVISSAAHMLCLAAFTIHTYWIRIHFAAHSNTSFNPNKWGKLQSKAKSLVWAALGVVGLCVKLIEEYLVCEMLQLSQQTSHFPPSPSSLGALLRRIQSALCPLSTRFFGLVATDLSELGWWCNYALASLASNRFECQHSVCLVVGYSLVIH